MNASADLLRLNPCFFKQKDIKGNMDLPYNLVICLEGRKSYMTVSASLSASRTEGAAASLGAAGWRRFTHSINAE